METVVAAGVVAFLLIAGLFNQPLLDIVLEICDDFKNHNDRGRLGKPSSKYVV